MFAQNMQSTAGKLIRKYGNDITLVYSYNCVYDPTKGEDVCDKTNYSIKATVESYTTAELSENVLIDDLRVLIQEDMTIDAEAWSVVYLGQTWKIVNIDTTTAQNKVITQLLQIRT